MTILQPGQTIGDRYVLEHLVYESPRITVVGALLVSLGQRVALKFLRPEVLGDAAAVERFHQEATHVASLGSRHVVQYLDFGVLDDGEPYQVMDYLEGPTLADLVHERGAPSVAQAVEWVLEVAGVVSASHAQGVVHRNLSLRNVLLNNRDATLKVMGFSVARYPALGPGDEALLGTPLTMSPEQLRSPREVDARTDVWALGAMLYELLAGVPPFRGDDVAQVALAVVSQPPAPLRDRRPDLPAGLEAAVRGALAKNPAERPASVEAWAEALRPFSAVG